MEEHDFLCRDGKVLILNPAIVFKGDYSRRGMVLENYREAKRNSSSSSLDSKMAKEALKRIGTIEADIKLLKAEERELKKLLKKHARNAAKETPKKDTKRQETTSGGDTAAKEPDLEKGEDKGDAQC